MAACAGRRGGFRDHAPDGGLAGAVVLARYPPALAVMGMLLVASRQGRRGVGRTLMQHVLAQVVYLHATAQRPGTSRSSAMRPSAAGKTQRRHEVLSPWPRSSVSPRGARKCSEAMPGLAYGLDPIGNSFRLPEQSAPLSTRPRYPAPLLEDAGRAGRLVAVFRGPDGWIAARGPGCHVGAPTDAPAVPWRGSGEPCVTGCSGRPSRRGRR